MPDVSPRWKTTPRSLPPEAPRRGKRGPSHLGRKRRSSPPDPISSATRAAVYERSSGDGEVRRCEARHSPRCNGRGEHLHHKEHRRHGDHSESNLLDVCHHCHDSIHRHERRERDGATVYDLGLIVRSNQALRKKALRKKAG